MMIMHGCATLYLCDCVEREHSIWGRITKTTLFTFGKDNSRQTERYLGALYFSGRRKLLSSRHIRVLINKGLRSVCLKTIT